MFCLQIFELITTVRLQVVPFTGLGLVPYFIFHCKNKLFTLFHINQTIFYPNLTDNSSLKSITNTPTPSHLHTARQQSPFLYVPLSKKSIISYRFLFTVTRRRTWAFAIDVFPAVALFCTASIRFYFLYK